MQYSFFYKCSKDLARLDVKGKRVITLIKMYSFLQIIKKKLFAHYVDFRFEVWKNHLPVQVC